MPDVTPSERLELQLPPVNAGQKGLVAIRGPQLGLRRVELPKIMVDRGRKKLKQTTMDQYSQQPQTFSKLFFIGLCRLQLVSSHMDRYFRAFCTSNPPVDCSIFPNRDNVVGKQSRLEEALKIVENMAHKWSF